MNISTERLLLRPLSMQDAPAIQKHFPHWDIVRHLSAKAIKWPYPADGAEKFLKNIALPAMEKGNDWYFGITRKDDPAGEVMGVVHLRRDIAAGNRGIWLGKPFQGQGYMQEAVGALNDFAFDVAGFDKLIIKNAALNEASRRLKQRTAARLIMTVPASHYLDQCPAQEIWELSAQEWHAFRAAERLKVFCTPQPAASPLLALQKLKDAFTRALDGAGQAVFCAPCVASSVRPAAGVRPAF